MNFKDWRKIQDGDDSAVFDHPNGCKLTVAKKKLSPKHLEDLKGLPLHRAEGGDVGEELPKEAMDAIEEPMDGPVEPQTGLVPQPAMNAEPLPGGEGSGPTPLEPQQSVIKGVGTEGIPLATAQNKPPPLNPEQLAILHRNEGNKEAAAEWQDRVNGHLTPKTYESMFAKKDTLGKIGTLFGLLLSGAGSGLSGQPNVLLDMMNKEIDRDLDKQKEEVKGAQNYYHLHQQNELNKANIGKVGAETAGLLKDVEYKTLENARTSMQLSAAHKALTMANMLPEGPQKAQALQGASNLQGAAFQDIDQRNARLGQNLVSDPEASYQKSQAGLRAAGNLGALPGAEHMARANDERHIPGVGEASIPVPDNVRAELISHQKLQDAGQDLLQYSKEHTNLIPGTPEYNTGVQKALVLQQMVREGLLGTVFRESEKPLLNKFVSENPAGALKAFSTQPKLRALLESNTMAVNALKKQYGLPTKHESKPEKPSKFKEGQTGTYQGKPVVFKNGKWGLR